MEHSLQLEPQAASLLDEVLNGELIAATELPTPQPKETQPPEDIATTDEQTRLAL